MSTERLAISVALSGHNNAVNHELDKCVVSAHALILRLVVNAYNKARGNDPHILPRGETGTILTLTESYPSTFKTFDGIY